MGASLFIALNTEVPGVSVTSVDGKYLLRNLDRLNEVAGTLAVRPIADFISVSPEDTAEFLEGVDGSLQIPPEQWFEAEEGLRTINSLLSHAGLHNPPEENLLRDLRDCKNVLEAAIAAHAMFHFSVDF